MYGNISDGDLLSILIEGLCKVQFFNNLEKDFSILNYSNTLAERSNLEKKITSCFITNPKIVE
jgi:hypothetical protein